MKIIGRAEWGARKPKSVTTVDPGQRQFFVIHHSGASAGQTVRAIQDHCMDVRGFNDIDYNYLIRSGTGEVYEGRGWNVVGSHTVGYNTSGLGVCVIGNNPFVDDKTAGALAWLYGLAVGRFGTLKVRGHGELTGATECPGARLRAFIAAGMPAPGEDDDMDQPTFNARMDAWWNDRMHPDNEPSAALKALRVAPWQQTVGREAASTHAVLFDEMRGKLDQVATDVAELKAALPADTTPAAAKKPTPAAAKPTPPK